MTHPELLLAICSAERLQVLLRTHPEVEQLYSELYRQSLTTTIQAITSRAMDNIDPPRLVVEIGTLERRLSHLVTPGGNWN